MKLSPQDVLNQQFNKKLKGFDREEVRNFLVQVAETLENEIREKEAMRAKIEKTKESLAKFERRDEILKDTLIAAQKFSHEIKTNTQREAELVIKEAEVKAEEIVGHSLKRQQDLREEIKNLKYKRKEVESDLLNMLNSLKGIIETYQQDDDDFEKIEFLSK